MLKLASAFVSIMDALNEGHNMKRSGSGRSYNSLKQKIQKSCEEINLMKEENERVLLSWKKSQEESMLKQKELELELMTSRQMHEDLRREKREGEKRLYTLEAELFLSKLAAEDLANENEELRQEKVYDDKKRFETARRAKKQKLSARRHAYGTLRSI